MTQKFFYGGVVIIMLFAIISTYFIISQPAQVTNNYTTLSGGDQLGSELSENKTDGQSPNATAQNSPPVVSVGGTAVPDSVPDIMYGGSGSASYEPEDTIGFAVGGAKDINNFRENIKNDYLPIPTDITYEGLFYDYYFDTGKTKRECKKLFCPSYSYAVTKDPLSKEDDYYLAVGLNSGMKESDFKRKKLNLVVVLDISGSMSSPFDRYYYDRFGNRINLDESEYSDKSKMEVATESVVALLDHLNDYDRFGLVLFDDVASLAKPLESVGEIDMDKTRQDILELYPMGGTQMSAGMKMGTDLFAALLNVDQTEYENRIIFLTDAMPNIGETSEGGLFDMMKKNADNKLYTTFIEIGVDFNTELVEYITKVRGANYYSVHSAKQFKKRMDDEFDFMVTPLVFNLLLKFDSRNYEIERIYGSPEADESTGELMKVNTLFPSKRIEGETKGGLVLLKLKKRSPQATIKLVASYEYRNGGQDSDEVLISFEDEPTEFFDNAGIRKGVLLSRYADLTKNWLIDEHESYQKNRTLEPTVTFECGIVVPMDVLLGKWERQSVPLRVFGPYDELFQAFASYFEKEMRAIGDNTLSRELDILKKLSAYTKVD